MCSPSARSTRQPAECTLVYGESERVDGGLDARRVVAERQEGAPAALDVDDERSVDDDHERARLAAWPVPGVGDVGGPLRPGKGGPERVRRVGGGEYQCPRRPVRPARRSDRPSASEDIARNRSTAPVVENWAAPSPATK